MEKNKKNLKELSILVLILVGITFIKNIVTVCINGFTVASQLPGIAADLVEITAIISFIIGLLLLLPEIYIGVKGIKIANGAQSGKAPIVWAVIFAILAGISVISGLSGIFKGFETGKFLDFLNAAIDVAVYVCYIVYVRKVLQAK